MRKHQLTRMKKKNVSGMYSDFDFEELAREMCEYDALLISLGSTKRNKRRIKRKTNSDKDESEQVKISVEENTANNLEG